MPRARVVALVLSVALGAASAPSTTTGGTFPGSNGKIAYGRAGDIYVTRADGTGKRRLTRSVLDDWGPAWSPSGRRLAFVRERANAPRGDEIYVATADGSRPRRLTNTLATESDPVWSPTGRKIAFVSGGGVGTFDIWVMDADGTSERRVTRRRGDDTRPTWSPGGRRIAYEGYNAATKSYDVFVTNADGTENTRLTTSRADEVGPDWSRRGKILFARHAQRGGSGLVVANGDGSGKTVLVATPYHLDDATWSPDGSRVAFTMYVGPPETSTTEIYVVPARGGEPARLTENGVNDFLPVWSPDGTKLAFTREESPSWNVWVMNADGSGASRLTSTRTSEAADDWQPLPRPR